MRNTLLLCIVLVAYCFTVITAQVDTGLRIDSARIASSFIMRDEYYRTDDCLAEVSQINTGFRKVARFDLALANLGNSAFQTTFAHPVSQCGGHSSFPNSFQVQVLYPDGSVTDAAPITKGICLEDTEKASGTPSGTAASEAQYECQSGTNGISVGWQTVVPRESDTMAVDLTPLIKKPNQYPGQFFIFRVTFYASQFCNCTDVELDYTFYLPFDLNCYPSPMYTTSSISPSYVDPAAASHSLITGWTPNYDFADTQFQTVSLGSFTFDPPPFCLSSSPTSIDVRDNGIIAFEGSTFLTSGAAAIEQNDNVRPSPAGSPFYLKNTVFVYWDAVFFINDTYTKIYQSVNATDVFITWVGIDRIASIEKYPITAQVNFKTNGDFIISYNAIPAGNIQYANGANASVGVCAGQVTDPSGNYSTPNTIQQSAVQNNCNLYSINRGDRLTLTSSIKFTRTTATTRQTPTRPTAVVTAPPSGQINSTYTFYANASTISGKGPAEYQWIWGDGSLPSYGISANHTYRTVGTYLVRLRVFDGIQFSKEGNFSFVATPIYLNNGTKTSGDGDGNATAGYIAIAVILPILFVLMLVVLVAILLFLFFRRHILSAGGAWWEEDPIYLNLEEQQ